MIPNRGLVVCDMGQQVASSLRADPAVAAWTTVSFVTADLDGQAVPLLFGSQ